MVHGKKIRGLVMVEDWVLPVLHVLPSFCLVFYKFVLHQLLCHTFSLFSFRGYMQSKWGFILLLNTLKMFKTSVTSKKTLTFLASFSQNSAFLMKG